MSFIDANLALLSRRQPALASQLSRVSNKSVKVFPSASGFPTACYERNSSAFALHSRYDPLREARQALKKHDIAGADYFILLGFGLGYILDALLEQSADPSNHYFVVESDLEILKAAMGARDLSSILSLSNLHFAWPVTGAELAEQWQRFLDPVQAQKSVFITHLPAVALDAGLFKNAAEIIQSQTFQIFTDINTLVGKSEAFLDNFVQNMRKAALAPGVAKFAGKFCGVPAVIVSAGPSLDKNIHELRGCGQRVLILSTDTALKPLLAAGIDPHFILTGDPSYLNYRHLKGASVKEALMVAEASSYPAVFDEFEGKTITCTFENSSLRSLSGLLGNKGTLRAWGSVATVALDFALLLGCNPVIFVGQDLAHSNGAIYCSGLCFDEEWFAGVLDPPEWRRRLESLRQGRRIVVVEDLFGRPVESTDKLTAYWNWMIKVFRDHPEIAFINATEGGILREGVRVESLREALHRYCSKSLDLPDRVKRAYEDSRENTLLYAGLSFSTLVGESAAIQDTLSLGLRLCKSSGGISPKELMKRLEAIKELIYGNPQIAPLLDCLNQMGNVAFLRKRNGITRGPLETDSLPNIRNAYADFFVSVNDALAKVNKALLKIGADLDMKPDLKAALARLEHGKNRYSSKHKLPIS